MSKLKAITSKAKILYKSGKYAKWTDAIKAASKSIAGTRIVKKSYTKKLGALPIDFKGNFLGYRFKILNQYQIDGGVTAQLVELDPPGDIIAQLSGNNKENDRVTNSLYASALATGKDIYLDKQDKSDLKKRINTFVIGLNKEVAAYNSGKDTTKKKSKGISLTYKPELKKLATVDKIKTILKEDKKILKGGYILKPGRIREKINGTGSHKDSKSHNVNIRVVSGIGNIGENFTRINNDANGNPRYVIHFYDLLNTDERLNIPFNKRYEYAIKKSKLIGGRKYHNKSYGGGIVFQSYNINDTWKKIQELKNKQVKIKY